MSTTKGDRPAGVTATEPGAGRVMLHFTMSLDGFIAGPNHETDWMSGFSELPPGAFEAYAEAVGAVLCGRDSFDVDPSIDGIYGGGWNGPVFLLTHHPEDAQAVEGLRVLSCDVAEAAAIGLEAAGGKDLEVFSASIGRQLLERGLVNGIELHIIPILLGRGIRLFDAHDGPPIRLENLVGDDVAAAITVRYRPLPAADGSN
ncbi:dihydrofolate reductase family protein [Glaciibacter superstes]|uniref:dihydrofolate reductase family protein n=1 Tax=Glaciibacter superstes TaxID=501023 RepID=UPI0003B67FAF|nr:dihydrofolate reductase family protein [Glaciibacter superstes]